MQYTQVRFLIYMIGYAVHPSLAPDVLYMIVSTVHLMANVVHPSEAPDLHDRIYSALDGKCSTPK